MIDYVERITRFARVTGARRQDTLFLDALGLADAVAALVLHAVEASPPGGPVMVTRTRRPPDHDATAATVILHAPDWTQIAVSDGGPGFAERVRLTADDPLITTGAGVRGAGMGPPLDAAFARAHRGFLTRERSGDRIIVSPWLPRP